MAMLMSAAMAMCILMCVVSKIMVACRIMILNNWKVVRELKLTEVKRDPLDFVLWKLAKPGEPHGIRRGARADQVGILNVRQWRWIY